MGREGHHDQSRPISTLLQARSAQAQGKRTHGPATGEGAPERRPTPSGSPGSRGAAATTAASCAQAAAVCRRGGPPPPNRPARIGSDLSPQPTAAVAVYGSADPITPSGNTSAGRAGSNPQPAANAGPAVPPNRPAVATRIAPSAAAHTPTQNSQGALPRVARHRLSTMRRPSEHCCAPRCWPWSWSVALPSAQPVQAAMDYAKQVLISFDFAGVEPAAPPSTRRTAGSRLPRRRPAWRWPLRSQLQDANLSGADLRTPPRPAVRDGTDL